MAARRHRRGERVAPSKQTQERVFAVIGLVGFGSLMYGIGRGSKPDCAAALTQKNTELLLWQQHAQRSGL